jgi:hypothetical protein
MPDQTLQEFNEEGAADTPTAGDALRMTAKARIIKRDPNEFYLVVDLHTEKLCRETRAQVAKNNSNKER